jgi:hypothetical protein
MSSLTQFLPAIALPIRGTIVITEGCKLSSRRRVETTACAA